MACCFENTMSLIKKKESKVLDKIKGNQKYINYKCPSHFLVGICGATRDERRQRLDWRSGKVLIT